MKVQILLVLLASVLATSQTITPNPSVPGAPGIVCAMTVCPTTTAALTKRQNLACPSNCPNDCQILDNVCCPGVQKAVCNADIDTEALTVTTTGTATAVSTSGTTPTTTNAAGTGGNNNNANTNTVTSATATTPTGSSDANTVTVVKSSVFILSITALMISLL
ncbi:MAG: hypothetical protein EXX96DRAFT_561872 [Benjaminiella poitrasii]|nr:MAG: hypothetical protein EXX96DRAFT_561872 [Benjaminiella poitrasii]